MTRADGPYSAGMAGSTYEPYVFGKTEAEVIKITIQAYLGQDVNLNYPGYLPLQEEIWRQIQIFQHFKKQEKKP